MSNDIILTPLPVTDLWAQIRAIIKDELKQAAAADLQEKLLTPTDAAAMLGISRVTLWDWTKAGRITKHAIGGRVFYKYSDLMQAINTGTVTPYRKPSHIKPAAL